MTSKLADNQLLKIARVQIDNYVDMGCFKKPSEATHYLINGFQLGYRYAEKKASALAEIIYGKDNLDTTSVENILALMAEGEGNNPQVYRDMAKVALERIRTTEEK